MVEAGADGVSEHEILDALDIAHGEIKKLVAAMEELQQKVGKEKIEHRGAEHRRRLCSTEIRSAYGQALVDAIATEGKLERYEAIDKVKDEVVAKYAPETGDRGRRPSASAEVKAAFDAIEKDTIRKAIAVDKKRPDGRAQDEIRPIECEVDISPRVHGSALFTRGETQILSNVALGTTRMDMRIDTLGLETTKTLLPPLQLPAVLGRGGRLHARPEAARHRPRRARRAGPGGDDPGRRGLPVRDPRGLRDARVQRLLLDGLGLRLLDGDAGRGRPGQRSRRRCGHGPDQGGRRLHRPHRHRRRRGPPRRHGLQGRRHRGRDHRPADGHQDHRRHLRDPRRTRWSRPARAVSSSSARWPRRSTGRARSSRQHAPAIESIKIDPEKIGAVIGKGGETIRALCEEFEAEIDVEDDGTVRIYAPTGDLVDACVARIDSMTKEAEIGDRYKAAKVVKTTTFGAFVELVKGTDGLLHISNVKPGERVDSVDDVLDRRRGHRRHRGRGRQGARPDRPAPLRRPLGRRQIRRRSWPRSAPATVGRGGGGGDRGGRGGDRGGRPPSRARAPR